MGNSPLTFVKAKLGVIRPKVRKTTCERDERRFGRGDGIGETTPEITSTLQRNPPLRPLQMGTSIDHHGPGHTEVRAKEGAFLCCVGEWPRKGKKVRCSVSPTWRDSLLGFLPRHPCPLSTQAPPQVRSQSHSPTHYGSYCTPHHAMSVAPLCFALGCSR